MTRMVHAHGAESNPQGDKDSQIISWTEFFTQLFPENTAASVAFFTRTSIRAAQLMLQRDQGPGRHALQNLLRSRVGPQVLDAIAGKADWRADEQRRLAIVDLERQLENLKLKRRELADDLRR